MKTILRLLIGLLFVGHGTQKLFGWFGGHGPDGTGQFFESIGLKPGGMPRASGCRRARPAPRRPAARSAKPQTLSWRIIGSG